MMGLALILLACAVFAALTAFSVTAALRSARVDDIIGQVFSPWIQDPFAASEGAVAVEAPVAAEASRSEAGTPTGQESPAASTDRRPMTAQA
ncbi:hypothetical protein [Brevundimonas sp.]|uniref:hypothetical protein n=1 Tax=Brevundimonas sp. TaxID=1871086 RepID=UPI002D22C982|nr:hypothetical protein [Brevundimonas sp.]HYC66876.1 hypothetical protein [Brevundimonas sp.]